MDAEDVKQYLARFSPKVEIPEKWTQEPPCFAITIGVRLRSHTKKEGWRGANNLLINGVDVILNLIFLFQNITSMLKNFQVAQDVTILHHFAYQKVSLINLS